MAPVVLDYDADGNVVGGHTVDALPARHYTDARMQTQARNSMTAQFASHPNASHLSPMLGSTYSPNGGPGPFSPSGNLVPQPQYSSMSFHPMPPQASYPQGLLRPPPTEPAAFRRQSQPTFEPFGYYQRPVHANDFQHFAQCQTQQPSHRIPQQGHFLNQPPQNYRPAGYQSFGVYGRSTQHQQRPLGGQQPPSGSRRHSYQQHHAQRFDQRFATQQYQPVASLNYGLRAQFSTPEIVDMGGNYREGQQEYSHETAPHPEVCAVEDLTMAQTTSRPASTNPNGEHGSAQQPPRSLYDDSANPELSPLKSLSDSLVARTKDRGESSDEDNAAHAEEELPVALDGHSAARAEEELPVALDENVSAQDLISTDCPPAPVHAKSVDDGLSFVNSFSNYFANDMTSLATFEVLCKNFNQERINELEFVTSMQRLLHRANASHLLPAFMEFIPATWKEANMTWLKDAVANDFDKKQRPVLREIDITAQTATKQKSKKKRPVNAFSTADSPNAPSRQALLVKLPVCLSEKPTALLTPPPSAVEPPIMPSPFIDPFQAGQPGNAQLYNEEGQGAITGPAQSSKNDSATNAMRKSLKSPKKRASVQRLAAAAWPAMNIIGGFNDTYIQMREINQLYSSQVNHIGPVFSGRRALLSRSSKPYIHGFCGKRFCHPADVKRHHKQINCVGLDGRVKDANTAWDEHPSCQADYPVLNYAKTLDGYIILDQESYDKMEAAIQAGLRTADQLANARDTGSATAFSDKVESDAEELSAEDEDTIDGMEEKEGTKASTKRTSLKATATKARKRVASASTASTPPATKKASLDETSEYGGSMARAAALGLRERK